MVERFRELYRFREVVRNFVGRDLKLRYRRSVLGFAWSLLNPLLFMGVLSVVFYNIMRFPLDHYALFVFSSLLPWLFFSQSVTVCTSSIITNEHFIRSQYFPKLVFPLCAVLQNLINFALSLLVLFLVMAPFLHARISWALCLLPLSIVFLFLTALGVGAILAVGAVYFRDLEHLIGIALTALMYLTPIIFPLEVPEGKTPLIPVSHQFYFRLNPLYYLIQMFTKPIWMGAVPEPWQIGAAAATALVSAGIGLALFFRLEDDLVFRL